MCARAVGLLYVDIIVQYLPKIGWKKSESPGRWAARLVTPVFLSVPVQLWTKAVKMPSPVGTRMLLYRVREPTIFSDTVKDWLEINLALRSFVRLGGRQLFTDSFGKRRQSY